MVLPGRIAGESETRVRLRGALSRAVFLGLAGGAGSGSGSGAGYHFGKNPIDLPVSGLELYIPTATSWRRDGRNYREGITPDIRVWWYEDDEWETRVKKLAWELRVVGSQVQK